MPLSLSCLSHLGCRREERGVGTKNKGREKEREDNQNKEDPRPHRSKNSHLGKAFFCLGDGTAFVDAVDALTTDRTDADGRSDGRPPPPADRRAGWDCVRGRRAGVEEEERRAVRGPNPEAAAAAVAECGGEAAPPVLGGGGGAARAAARICLYTEKPLLL